MDYAKLQNGSDIRGVAMEGIEGQSVNLTDEAVEAIGSAVVVYLSEKLKKEASALRLSVGRDSRLSGERLYNAVARGITKMGASLTNFGLASTPSMFMSTVTGRCFDGAIMLTASHLPWNRNGIKLFTAQGGFEKSDIAAVLALAGKGGFTYAEKAGAIDTCDFLSDYAAGLCEIIKKGVNAEDYDHPLKGFHIVVDAGNGAGGFYAEKVLNVLGADTTGSQFLEPDGHFPNHQPNPEDKAAMDAAQACVLDNRADFGVIFDTDVDRAGAVSADGKELNRNVLIALISAILLEEHPGTTIVTDSITSSGLAKFIAEKGGTHLRFKRGYRNVINESVRLNALGQDSQLAIETSGHAALKENYFLDDGAYLVTRLLIELARGKKEGYTLESLIADLAEPKEGKEFRMNILLDDFKSYGQQVIDRLGAYAQEQEGWSLAPNNFEGIRVNLDPAHGNGWFLLRLSLHDPLMPLNIESDSVGGVLTIAKELFGFMKTCDKLDLSPLEAFVK